MTHLRKMMLEELQGRKSLCFCLTWWNVRWFDPIAEASELPNHSPSAQLLRSFAHGWAAFLEQLLPSFPVFYECRPVAGMLDQPAGICFSIAITRPSGTSAASGALTARVRPSAYNVSGISGRSESEWRSSSVASFILPSFSRADDDGPSRLQFMTVAVRQNFSQGSHGSRIQREISCQSWKPFKESFASVRQ